MLGQEATAERTATSSRVCASRGKQLPLRSLVTKWIPSGELGRNGGEPGEVSESDLPRICPAFRAHGCWGRVTVTE